MIAGKIGEDLPHDLGTGLDGDAGLVFLHEVEYMRVCV